MRVYVSIPLFCGVQGSATGAGCITLIPSISKRILKFSTTLPPSPLPISWLKVSVPEVLRFPAQSFHGFFPVLPGGLIGSPFRIPQDSFMFDSTCSSFR